MYPNYDIEAIVVKGIPLELSKDTLEKLFRRAGCPRAWAFAYLLEHGQFTGTAFINYYCAEDANLVIKRMHNYEIGQNQLHIKYKSIYYAKFGRGRIFQKREQYAEYKSQQESMRHLATIRYNGQIRADFGAHRYPRTPPTTPTEMKGNSDLTAAEQLQGLDRFIQDLDEKISMVYEAQQVGEIGAVVEDAEEPAEPHFWLPTSLFEAMSK